MADYIVKDTELTSVANAIRTAGGTSSLLNFPNGFVSAVNNISGGSSDFSTAQVMVVNNTSNLISGAYVYVNDGAPFSAVVSMNALPIGSKTYNVPLYKGVCFWDVTSGTALISVSGNVEWNSEYEDLFITGDGTITITDGGGSGNSGPK